MVREPLLVKRSRQRRIIDKRHQPDFVVLHPLRTDRYAAPLLGSGRRGIRRYTRTYDRV